MSPLTHCDIEQSQHSTLWSPQATREEPMLLVHPVLSWEGVDLAYSDAFQRPQNGEHSAWVGCCMIQVLQLQYRVVLNIAAVLQNGYCSFWFVLELMGLMGNNVEDVDAEYGDCGECERGGNRWDTTFSRP